VEGLGLAPGKGGRGHLQGKKKDMKFHLDGRWRNGRFQRGGCWIAIGVSCSTSSGSTIEDRELHSEGDSDIESVGDIFLSVFTKIDDT
jgi:hypothetical protein